MNKDTGGAAFPGFQYTDGRGEVRKNADGEWEIFHAGMTLRDYFAAAALTGLANPMVMKAAEQLAGNSADQKIAQSAYEFADAMLAERAKS